MEKHLYQAQQSTVKYHFSFRTLSDQNMKMGCHAVFFLQRPNLVPGGCIILDRTHNFHGIFGNSLENLQKLSVYGKLSKREFSTVNAWKPLLILERI